MSQEPITSVQNPFVKHLVKLRTQARYRAEHNQVVVCSKKLIQELSQFVKPLEIIGEGGRFVSESVLKKITGHLSPEGAVALFALPQSTVLQTRAPLLALDRIADPGNLGTLLRTAWALGWQGVFFLPGCVDPFHEKVLSASRAALFSLPWQSGSWDALKELCEEQQLESYVADMVGKPLGSVPSCKKVVVVMSNEAQGVSDAGAGFGTPLSIPMIPEAESLNVAVAGALIMHHLHHCGEL